MGGAARLCARRDQLVTAGRLPICGALHNISLGGG